MWGAIHLREKMTRRPAPYLALLAGWSGVLIAGAALSQFSIINCWGVPPSNVPAPIWQTWILVILFAAIVIVDLIATAAFKTPHELLRACYFLPQFTPPEIDRQKWILDPDDGEFYRITSQRGGKVFYNVHRFAERKAIAADQQLAFNKAVATLLAALALAASPLILNRVLHVQFGDTWLETSLLLTQITGGIIGVAVLAALIYVRVRGDTIGPPPAPVEQQPHSAMTLEELFGTRRS